MLIVLAPWGKVDAEILFMSPTLGKEAQRLSNKLGGTAKLMAKGLDLRPRLRDGKGPPRQAGVGPPR
jgi:hypothetical protein